MPDTGSHEHIAHLVDPEHAATLDVLGPTVQLLTPLDDNDDAPCVMRGTIPPGVSIPLHAHADPETFYVISGEAEGLALTPDRVEWIRIGPGDVFHVPGWVKHAWRNRGRTPADMLLIATSGIGRFFREIGTPVDDPDAGPTGPPSEEVLRRFLATAERYGHWIGTPEENERIGIDLPPAQVDAS